MEAVDPATGNVLYFFDSVADAQRQGYGDQAVYYAIRKANKPYRRMLWRWGLPRAGTADVVEACCPTTGKVLFQCRNYNEIKARGYLPKNVTQAAREQSVYRHLCWRYANLSPSDQERLPEPASTTP